MIEEISSAELRELAKVRNGPFLKKLAIFLVLTAISIGLILYLQGGIVWIAIIVPLGLMYAHAIELQHQALHNTALHSKRWNRVIGVILGLPMFVSFSDYQNSHMRHHRLLGTPEDREFFNYNYELLTTLKAFIPHLFMVRHYLDVSKYMCQSIKGGMTREASPSVLTRIRNEYLIMTVLLILAVVITVAFQTAILFKLWFLPLLIAVPTHALIELPEHIGCDMKTTNVLLNTRTIMAGRLAVWFTAGNNYHVEHHWLPSIPNNNFPLLNRKVVDKIKYLESSYWRFYYDFIHRLYRKKAYLENRSVAD